VVNRCRVADFPGGRACTADHTADWYYTAAAQGLVVKEYRWIPCERREKTVINQSAAEAGMDTVMRAVGSMLERHGFVLRGMLFRKTIGDTSVLVEFQKSDQSSRERQLFTINLAIVCGKLLPAGSSALPKADVTDGHLTQRLGFLLPEKNDKWWELTDRTNTAALSKQMIDAMVGEALPYLDRFLTPDALIELWESGKSPGLTAVQRARFLSQLRKAVGLAEDDPR
jgi:hypothetical protein